MTRFNAAEAFHVNFHQDARDLDELQDGLDNAKSLIGLLEEAKAMDKSVGIPHGLKRRVSATGIRHLRYPRGRKRDVRRAGRKRLAPYALLRPEAA